MAVAATQRTTILRGLIRARFTAIRIDVTDGADAVQATARRFQASGLPALRFLDPAGVEIEELRLDGGIGVEPLRELLGEIDRAAGSAGAH
jgi:thiol:disulfide interchange protein